MIVTVRHSESPFGEVEVRISGGETTAIVNCSIADLVILRDTAATFIAGQELPGAEIARQRKATGLLGGTQ